MKTNLFTIALAVATMVPVFGAQQAQSPATPAKPAVSAPAASTAKPDASKSTTATTTKKHHKKAVKKNSVKPSDAVKPAASTPVVKPAGSSK